MLYIYIYNGRRRMKKRPALLLVKEKKRKTFKYFCLWFTARWMKAQSAWTVAESSWWLAAVVCCCYIAAAAAVGTCGREPPLAVFWHLWTSFASAGTHPWAGGNYEPRRPRRYTRVSRVDAELESHKRRKIICIDSTLLLACCVRLYILQYICAYTISISS